MRTAMLLALLLLWQATPRNESPVARPDAMRYERVITTPTGSGQACAALDAQVFPHAAPSLADVRIFPSGSVGAKPQEVPYAITLSESETEETQAARVLNLGSAGGKIGADLLGVGSHAVGRLFQQRGVR